MFSINIFSTLKKPGKSLPKTKSRSLITKGYREGSALSKFIHPKRRRMTKERRPLAVFLLVTLVTRLQLTRGQFNFGECLIIILSS